MLNPRTHLQPYLGNSLTIRQEIQRFESVHPSIYAIYDLIEAIPDPLIQQQIREHVVCIEDSFVNSQEWTLARSVPDLKLGILGSVNSGKSALVHRYLTGSYMQEESPEGGRFKKEVVIDGQSHLLLIRDEGGGPEMQFVQWCDAVIFVFSLENEMSFNTIYSYYAKMAHYRNTAEIPIILVATQDAISESNPRVIDDTRARKLASDLKRCSYYETCATYGLNVERVFQDACQKIVQTRYATPTPTNSRPSTPNYPSHAAPQRALYAPPPPREKPFDTHSTSSQSTSGSGTLPHSHSNQNQNQGQYKDNPPTTPRERDSRERKKDKKQREKEAEKERERERREQEKAAYLSQRQAQQEMAQQQQLQQQLQSLHNQQQMQHQQQFQQSLQQQLEQQLQMTDKPESPQEVMVTYREPPSPLLTPRASRKNKKTYNVQKSNSFSGSITGERPTLANPSVTPILPRKEKNRSHIFTDLRELPSPRLTPKLRRKKKNKSPDISEELASPTSTPLLSRKSKTPSYINKKDEKDGKGEKKGDKKNGVDSSLGSGRVIPIRQGYLYKKSSKGLTKEWKKKYVALGDNGKLTYHPSLHDYMDDVHGKEIALSHTTVKIPGQAPKGSRGTGPIFGTNGIAELNNIGKGKENVLLTAYDDQKERLGSVSSNCDDAVIIPNSSITSGVFNGPEYTSANSKIETPNVKKRHRRAKSSTSKNIDNGDDSDGYEFQIVSLDNKTWNFEAPSYEEREVWVSAVEQQILSSLQLNESSKSKATTATDPAAIQSIRSTKGNMYCVDCGAPNPDWASLNLGALLCIECSGVHRNLGTHLSRVRSLDLDEWPPELVAVMTNIGNHVANSVWEANAKGLTKPTPSSSREEKEAWIRAKYEQREFLPPMQHLEGITVGQQLIDAVARGDIFNIIHMLARSDSDQVNSPFSSKDSRTALHIAATLGNIVFIQLLLWYNADVNITDSEGRYAIWYARNSGSQECIEFLRQNGCPENPTLPRRRAGSTTPNPKDNYEKLPNNVI
ncbi:unnamed protein product [Owenia fusiformis]|uniref:Centaurin-gamma-1A n=1 Tax=Owenia fusiformis TaxID=6347 RepID=A0A8S4N5V1_OWEFU|nr:unnamed protein product [Owenia fusiformis]